MPDHDSVPPFAHEERLRRYLAVLDAAVAVRQLPVWPFESDDQGRQLSPEPIEPLHDVLVVAARGAGFLAPPEVNTSMRELVDAVAELVGRVRAIRQTGSGHGRDVYGPLRGDYRDCCAAVDSAMTGFVRAARADVGIDGEFTTLPNA